MNHLTQSATDLNLVLDCTEMLNILLLAVSYWYQPKNFPFCNLSYHRSVNSLFVFKMKGVWHSKYFTLPPKMPPFCINDVKLYYYFQSSILQ
jgi:hypothetical protein